MNAAWTTIVLAGIGTFLMRTGFLLAADRMAELPPWATRLLRQIPPAALAAIVLPAFLRGGGSLDLWSPRMAAGVVAAVVAWRTRNTALTLGAGLAVVILLEW